MYPHQSERLTAALDEAGLDALVATTPANIVYVTGFQSLIQATYPGVELYAVFSRGGTALVLPAADAVTAAVESVDVDHVSCYGRLVLGEARRADDVGRRAREWTREPAPGPADALAAALDAVRAAGGRIGVDEAGLRPGAWRRVVERLAGRTVVEGAGALAGARRVKGPWEIECLQRALHVTEEAANEVIQALEPGMTEREAAARFLNEVITRGAEPRGTVLLFGERTAFPAVGPSDRALRTGDLVRLDVGCVLKGYHAQVARTAVAGKPSDDQQRAHAAIQSGLEAGLEAVRPGVTAGAVFDRAVDAARAAGLLQFDREQIGYGIGLEPSESPKLTAGNGAQLQTGMVLRIDTPYYEPGWGGVHLGDTVLVTRNGHAVMNRSARGLVVLD
ncbi:MAG TPA: Xaa-Pro peptidase family protein [Methylomirabilota bacterium]|nr:Xaa-Pro peptidase family protein [Methylomirabilota bacterium]